MALRLIHIAIEAEHDGETFAPGWYATAPCSWCRDRPVEVVSPSVIDNPKLSAEHFNTVPSASGKEGGHVLGMNTKLAVGRAKGSLPHGVIE